MTKHLSLILLYLIAFILYLYYLLNIKLGINISVVYFWIAIIFMIASLFIQIISFNFTKLQLFEIIIFRFAVQLMYVVPHYGLFGWDPEPNLYISNFVSSYGWNTSLLGFRYIGIHWPILSFFSLVSSILLNVQLLDIAKWFPSVYSSISVIFIYLISKTIFNNDKSALLSCFLMSTISWYAEFHSWYVQESIGFVFMLSLLYLFFKQEFASFSSNNIMSYRLISIVLLFTLTMSHHFSSFALVVVVITFYIIRKVYVHIGNEHTYLNMTYPLLSIITLISYWIFIAPFPFRRIVSIYLNLFTTDAVPTSNIFVPTVYLTLRQLVIRYGGYLFIVIFGIISLYSVKLQRKSRNFGALLSMVLFNVFLGCLYISSAIFPHIIFLASNRILIYAWLFSLVLSMGIYVSLKDISSKVFIAVCFIFVIFNIYSISPYIYSISSEPQYNIHEFSFSHPLKEYKAVQWYNKYHVGKSNAIASGQNAIELFAGPGVDDIYTDIDLFEGNLSKIDFYDWIYTYDEVFNIMYDYKNNYLTRMSKCTLDIYDSESSINLVYNNNLTRLYTRSSL